MKAHFLLSLLLLPATIFAQKQQSSASSLDIGGITIRQGMSTTQALKLFSEAFTVDFDNAKSAYMISIHKTKGLGKFFVKNGMVTTVMKFYDADPDTDKPLIINQAITDITSLARTATCVVSSVKKPRDDGINESNLFIQCGRYVLQVDFDYFRFGDSQTIHNNYYATLILPAP